MNVLWAGAGVGLVLGIGLLLVVVRPRRLSPVRRAVMLSRLSVTHEVPRTTLRSTELQDAVDRLLDHLWSARSVIKRQERAGLLVDVQLHRIGQLRSAALGIAVVLGFGLLRTAAGHPPPAITWLVLCAVGAFCAAALYDRRLTQRADARRVAMEQELPTVAELLAYSVSAGLSPQAALSRVSNRLGGELAAELRRCTDEVAAGRLLTDVLASLADRVQSPTITRFVDGMVTAIERGTPLAAVLRAQALDVLDTSHQQLMASMGRREIFALIPVVFFILPTVVVVAVYPGFAGLLMRG